MQIYLNENAGMAALFLSVAIIAWAVAWATKK